MHGLRATRLFPIRSQRPWLRGRRHVAFSDLVRAAESGDADAIEGLLSLALSPDGGDSPLARQALATLEDLLAESQAQSSASGHRTAEDTVGRRARTLACLEAEAQCFELAEKAHQTAERMPSLLLRAASRHAADRGYHVTGERIGQVLAARGKAEGAAPPATPVFFSPEPPDARRR